jgi:hypothetical protein
MPKPPLNRMPWRTTDGKVIAAKGQPELNILIEEAELFKAADKLRGNMEPSDYKHVALGLIFLKHISDSFEAKRSQLLAEYPDGAEDPDEYSAENVFWVPKEARWSQLLPPLGRPRNKNRRWRISHHGKYCLLSWLVRKSRASSPKLLAMAPPSAV